MPIVVKIDRPTCLSDGVCSAACPEVFSINEEDGLARLAEEYRTNGELGEGIIPDDLMDCAQKAADLCPVLIISVEDK